MERTYSNSSLDLRFPRRRSSSGGCDEDEQTRVQTHRPSSRSFERTPYVAIAGGGGLVALTAERHALVVDSHNDTNPRGLPRRHSLFRSDSGGGFGVESDDDESSARECGFDLPIGAQSYHAPTPVRRGSLPLRRNSFTSSVRVRVKRSHSLASTASSLSSGSDDDEDSWAVGGTLSDAESSGDERLSIGSKHQRDDDPRLVRCWDFGEPIQGARVHGGAIDASCGRHHLVILTDDGCAWASGSNTDGQLGLPVNEVDICPLTCPVRLTPLVAQNGLRVVQVAAGALHTLLLLSDGSVVSCGSGVLGQLGCGRIVERQDTPSPVALTDRVAAVFAGGDVSFFLTTNQREPSQRALWACGDGRSGALGLGDWTSRSTPARLDTHSTTQFGQNWGVASLATSGRHTIVALDDGSLLACGANDSGQTGLANIERRLVKVIFPLGNAAGAPIAPLIRQVAVSERHSLLLDDTGNVYASGCNDRGQIDDLTSRSRESHTTYFSPLSLDRITTGLRNVELERYLEDCAPTSANTNATETATVAIHVAACAQSSVVLLSDGFIVTIGKPFSSHHRPLALVKPGRRPLSPRSSIIDDVRVLPSLWTRRNAWVPATHSSFPQSFRAFVSIFLLVWRRGTHLSSMPTTLTTCSERRTALCLAQTSTAFLFEFFALVATQRWPSDHRHGENLRNSWDFGRRLWRRFFGRRKSSSSSAQPPSRSHRHQHDRAPWDEVTDLVPPTWGAEGD